MSQQRRTQAQRREQTYQQVLASACKLFGKKGYNATSMEDIANDCQLTTRPIYHYFGNKKALFAAVNQAMEQRIIEGMLLETSSKSSMANWAHFLSLCDDPAFRQIVLIDSPNVLGRKRWSTSDVSKAAQQTISDTPAKTQQQKYRNELLSRILMGAFAECALMIAQAKDTALAKQEADSLMQNLFGRLS